MSLVAHYLGVSGFGFPRVSGDEPATSRQTLTPPQFSPRERG